APEGAPGTSSSRARAPTLTMRMTVPPRMRSEAYLPLTMELRSTALRKPTGSMLSRQTRVSALAIRRTTELQAGTLAGDQSRAPHQIKPILYPALTPRHAAYAQDPHASQATSDIP